jgi:hypothetical protein
MDDALIAANSGNSKTKLESFIFWGIQSQFALYFFGFAPIAPLLLAWPLVIIAGWKFLKGELKLSHWIGVLWLSCMSGLLIQGIWRVYSNGTGGTYLARWPFAFGLAAFLPLAGALIRFDVVAKASLWLGIQALFYAVIVIGVITFNVPISYSSWIPKFAVLPSEYFNAVVIVNEALTTGGEERPVAFTPYATYAAAVSCVYSLMALAAPRSKFKIFGVLGWIAVLALTRGRAGWVCFAGGMLLFVALHFPRRYLLAMLGIGLLGCSVFLPPIWSCAEQGSEILEKARPTSSEVRHNLRRLAKEEWQFGDSPLLGTGLTITGSSVVANMPIGTHDTINSNLMIRGIGGLALIVVPLWISLLYFLCSPTGRMGASVSTICAVLFIYMYAENLEGILMFTWPCLLLIGSAMKQEVIEG